MRVRSRMNNIGTILVIKLNLGKKIRLLRLFIYEFLLNIA